MKIKEGKVTKIFSYGGNGIKCKQQPPTFFYSKQFKNVIGKLFFKNNNLSA